MTDTAATHALAALRAALPALRLNRSFPPWRAIDAHLQALQIEVPGQPLALLPGTAWPHPDAWLRVRVDSGLAEEMLPVMRPLARSGDAEAQARVVYFEAIASCRPLRETVWQTRLVGHEPGRVKVEITVDQHIFAVPTFRRITLRIATPVAGPIKEDGHRLSIEKGFQQTILEAGSAPARGFVALSGAGAVESLTVGEVGPARNGVKGPWLSAVLTRVSTALDRTFVDDALESEVELPRPDRPERLSRQRKWAIPRADVSTLQGWLAERGSRNLHYTYRLPGARP